MVDRNDQANTIDGLYREHRQGLYSLALAITRSPDRAEDAVHEAFTRLCRQPSGPQFNAAYVFAAVRNAARDQLRRLRPAGELPVSIFDDGPQPDATALADEAKQAVQQCLEGLDEPQREVIVLKIYGDLTFDQIAHVTGEPLQTIASRYRRALLTLKDRLESCV
jgi:RNA polymerase sigma-70 factor, ECF subfamily